MTSVALVIFLVIPVILPPGLTSPGGFDVDVDVDGAYLMKGVNDLITLVHTTKSDHRLIPQYQT